MPEAEVRAELDRNVLEIVRNFIDVQRSQSTALDKLAEAVKYMSNRADKLDEMLVGQQLVLRRQEDIEKRLNGIEGRLASNEPH